MKLDIVRTWKDEGYRQELSEEGLNMLPSNPAGEIELSDAQLESIYGADGYGGGGPVGGAPAPGLGGGGPVGGGVGGGPIGGGPLGGPFPFGGGVGLGFARTSDWASSSHIHSDSVLCDINIFSLNVSVLNIISIASSSTQTCVNAD